MLSISEILNFCARASTQELDDIIITFALQDVCAVDDPYQVSLCNIIAYILVHTVVDAYHGCY